MITDKLKKMKDSFVAFWKAELSKKGSPSMIGMSSEYYQRRRDKEALNSIKNTLKAQEQRIAYLEQNVNSFKKK